MSEFQVQMLYKLHQKVWKSKSSLVNNERRLVLGQMFDPLTHESGDQAMAVFMKGLIHILVKMLLSFNAMVETSLLNTL